MDGPVDGIYGAKTEAGVRILKLNDSALYYLSELKQYDLRNNIEKAIKNLPDNLLSEILYRKYILGKTLEEISFTLNYSKRHIERLHLKALEIIENKIILKNCSFYLYKKALKFIQCFFAKIARRKPGGQCFTFRWAAGNTAPRRLLRFCLGGRYNYREKERSKHPCA